MLKKILGEKQGLFTARGFGCHGFLEQEISPAPFVGANDTRLLSEM
jgi:hypothetical protein